ncbi:sensor histidine kinase [Leptolyngbya ohadii]|uniref:sensor histidine kinase n=1 Tax=Leptolyngbya ohadii TaxID=1962290 RepID=UPI000B599856|nr:CHASE3 domain-containing protein [Leptolyngbya ohadii]
MLLSPPQIQFRRRLTRAIALPIVLLLLLSGVSIWQITRLLSALRWVDHTNEVISQANLSQKLLLDMETGLRGYLLTGEQNFLEPYEQANLQIDSSLEQLKSLVSDNLPQVQRVAELERQAQQWEQQAVPAISRQRGASEPLISLERRKQSMDQMRQQIASFIATEEQLRNQRSRIAQQTTRSVIFTSLFLAVGVGGVLAYFLRRQILRVSDTYETALQTAQVKTEEAQQSAAALQQYKDIFQFAEHGLVVGASDSRTLTLMNPAFARMHGYTVAELEKTPILNLFPPDRHTEAIEFVQQVNERGYYAFESLHCRKDGNVFPVFLGGTAVRDADGNLLYRIVSVHDITENKQAKLALQRSAQRLAALHDIDRAILASETDETLIGNALNQLRQIVPHQQAFVALFDLQAGVAQMIAGNSQSGELSHPIGTQLMIADFAPEQSLLSGIRSVENLTETDNYPPVLMQLRANGFCSCLCVPLLVESVLIGELNLAAIEPAAFNNEAQDIAREVAAQLAIALQQSRLRKQLQTYATQLEQRVADRTAQLAETNQELEAFTYSVSHDLRAPLRTIQGFAKALLEDCGEHLDEFCRSYIDSIIDDTNQMNGLISDLLAYSRLTRAQIRLQPTALDTVITEALSQLTAQITERQAQIRVVSPLPQVIAHRSTLIQVIANLISNAIKFVAPNISPQIDIFTTDERQDEQDSIRLWIADNGIGIASEHQERVFRVFERLHGAESYPGTGIGLAIVRKGLERMGGQVGVESQLGHGSRFWVALPSAVLPQNKHTYDPTSPNSSD